MQLAMNIYREHTFNKKYGFSLNYVSSKVECKLKKVTVAGHFFTHNAYFS